MKKILILGGTGKLGKVVVETLLKKGYTVTALVRNTHKLNLSSKNLHVLKGDCTSKKDLLRALVSSDAVISTLGHGFRTSYPLQEKTLHVLIPLLNEKQIKRFITVTGAGLKVKGDPRSLIADVSEKLFHIVDPYRMNDAKSQQSLLEKSNLNWTVVRTPIHNGNKQGKISHIVYTQPPFWATLSRIAIANFIVDCIEDSKYVKKSPIIF